LLTNYRDVSSACRVWLEIVECVPLAVGAPAPPPQDNASKIAKLR